MSRYLTEYCQAKEIPYIVMQSWKGSGEDSYLEGYLLINATNKQIEFVDERSQVLEIPSALRHGVHVHRAFHLDPYLHGYQRVYRRTAFVGQSPDPCRCNTFDLRYFL